MRKIIFAASAIALMGCAAPAMVASNGASDQQQAASVDDRDPPAPPQLRQPPRRGWGGNIYRGRFAY